VDKYDKVISRNDEQGLGERPDLKETGTNGSLHTGRVDLLNPARRIQMLLYITTWGYKHYYLVIERNQGYIVGCSSYDGPFEHPTVDDVDGYCPCCMNKKHREMINATVVGAIEWGIVKAPIIWCNPKATKKCLEDPEKYFPPVMYGDNLEESGLDKKLFIGGFPDISIETQTAVFNDAMGRGPDDSW
jgi:hypothetical protein